MSTTEELQAMGAAIREAAEKVSGMMFSLTNWYEGLMGYKWQLLVKDHESGKRVNMEWINLDEDDLWDPQPGEAVSQARFSRMQRVNYGWFFWKSFNLADASIEKVRKYRTGPVQSVIDLNGKSKTITETLFTMTKDDTEAMAKIPEVLGEHNGILEKVSAMASNGENAAQTMMNNVRGSDDSGQATANGAWVGKGADAYHKTVSEQKSAFHLLRDSSDSLQAANVALANDTNELMQAFVSAYEARVESTKKWGTLILGVDQLAWTTPVTTLYSELMDHEKKTAEEHRSKLQELADQATTDLIVEKCKNARVTVWPSVVAGSMGDMDH